jgi:NAD(P)-dependent dehydrogenase (short-subunit alcohol dehydrogenase family)
MVSPSTEQRRTALVTAATAGIGFFIAAGLAQRGWEVVVTGRDRSRGERAAEDLCERAGHDAVTFIAVDHSIVAENTRLAATVVDRLGTLDLLVNNAGGIYAQRWDSADGYEGTLAMNFVAPVALTMELLTTLRQAHGCAINVVSSAFKMAKGDPFAELTLERNYVGINAYALGKRLNVLWMQALAVREPEITVYAVNPGMAWTPSTQALTPAAVPSWRLVWPIVRWFQRRASAEKAAATPIAVAVAQNPPPTGTYIDDKGKPAQLPDGFSDDSLLARVWALGETLVANAPTASSRPDPDNDRRSPAHGDGGRPPNLDVGGSP